MKNDPVMTNPQFYRVVMENERVRVLEYRDRPGDRTTPHQHPDSVMYTLSAENVGDSESHVIFVELKEQRSNVSGADTASSLGPSVA